MGEKVGRREKKKRNRLGRREKLAQKSRGREKLAQKLGRREISPPVPPPPPLRVKYAEISSLWVRVRVKQNNYNTTNPDSS